MPELTCHWYGPGRSYSKFLQPVKWAKIYPIYQRLVVYLLLRMKVSTGVKGTKTPSLDTRYITIVTSKFGEWVEWNESSEGSG